MYIDTNTYYYIINIILRNIKFCQKKNLMLLLFYFICDLICITIGGFGYSRTRVLRHL